MIYYVAIDYVLQCVESLLSIDIGMHDGVAVGTTFLMIL